MWVYYIESNKSFDYFQLFWMLYNEIYHQLDQNIITIKCTFKSQTQMARTKKAQFKFKKFWNSCFLLLAL